MESAIEILKYGNAAVFCGLTVACLRHWWARGYVSIRWAAAAFGSLAAVSLISLILQQPSARGLAGWFIKGLLVVLVLFPYFLYRFAVAFQRPPRLVALTAWVSTAVVVVWTLAVPSFPVPGAPEPLSWTLYRVGIIVQWTILFAIVAARLWGGGRDEGSVSRFRMRTLALAAMAMMGATLLSGVAPAPTSPTITLLTQALFFGSAILFYVGLAPPRWLLQSWRRTEDLAMQATMAALFRAESQAEVAALLLPPVAGLVGARGAALVKHSGELIVSHGSTDAETKVLQLARMPVGTAVPGIHRVELDSATLLMWTSPYAPFFGQDEFALTESLGVFADIVMERCALADVHDQARQALAYQATHDSLTGLPNRVLFMDRLIQAQARLKRRQGALSVLFLDLDRFKLVNDTFDHVAGDVLLKAVAQRLAGALRDGDTVARFGGDEFVVLAEVSGEREALGLGDRLLAALATAFTVDGRELSVTASVGVVVTRDQEDPVHLVRNADVAMYRAKDSGRARVKLFDEQMQLAIAGRLGMERELRQAIAEQSLTVHYQPVIRFADAAVVSVEALLRWHHPRFGQVPPAEFIPIAEESDLIVEVGTFVLEEACRQAAAWRDTIRGRNEFVVWVNVSGAQFSRMDVPATVASVLEAYALEPHALGLEITESVFVEQADALYAALTKLRTLGVSIAIDDFGTGFSSLSRLRNLPADVVKIDGSFVQALGDTPQDAAIVAACIAMADALGLTVVAECVETSDQLAALVAKNCCHGQGYYFSAPLSAEEATRYLRRPDPGMGLTAVARQGHGTTVRWADSAGRRKKLSELL